MKLLREAIQSKDSDIVMILMAGLLLMFVAFILGAGWIVWLLVEGGVLG